MPGWFQITAVSSRSTVAPLQQHLTCVWGFCVKASSSLGRESQYRARRPLNPPVSFLGYHGLLQADSPIASLSKNWIQASRVKMLVDRGETKILNTVNTGRGPLGDMGPGGHLGKVVPHLNGKLRSWSQM